MPVNLKPTDVVIVGLGAAGGVDGFLGELLQHVGKTGTGLVARFDARRAHALEGGVVGGNRVAGAPDDSSGHGRALP